MILVNKRRLAHACWRLLPAFCFALVLGYAAATDIVAAAVLLAALGTVLYSRLP